LTKYCFGQDAVTDNFLQSRLGGYSVVFQHIKQTFKDYHDSALSGSSSPFNSLSGEFTIEKSRLSYTMHSFGYWLDHDLIIKHKHLFHSMVPETLLRANDILSLPLRLCPHQTTTTAPPPRTPIYTE
jgi:hypothetical protein